MFRIQILKNAFKLKQSLQQEVRKSNLDQTPAADTKGKLQTADSEGRLRCQQITTSKVKITTS